MANYTDEFIAESLELLYRLEQILLALDNDPDNQEELEELLRGLHTLKGSSGMYGFEKIGHIMHAVENVFDQAKTKQQKISTAIINLTLETVDFSIQVFKSKHDVDEQFENEYELLQKRIDKLIKKNNQLAQVAGLPREQTAGQAESNAVNTYLINLPILGDFERRGVKIDNILSELEAIGKVISIPFKDDRGEVGEWEIFVITAASMEELEDVFIFLLDVVSIHLLANENLLLNDQFKSVVQKNSALKIRNNVSDLKELIQEIESEGKPPVNLENKSNQQSHINKEFLRVAAEKLDEQMDLLSELVTAKAELRMIVESEKYAKLYKLVESLDKITNSFRKNILNTRLVPVKNWYVPFLRLIRDVSKQLNKEVEFVTEGLETEIDKNIIDRLEGPLTHIIRNSLDHGIETPEERIKNGKSPKATITLKAYHSGSDIYLEIHDDGRGLDKEKIRQKAIQKGLIDAEAVLSPEQIHEIIFLPGFSTASQLTEVSGRGIGMDVLRKAINQLRGEILVESIPGNGTKVLIKLPMLLSIIDTLLIRSAQQYFAIPLPEVQKCTQIKQSDLILSDNEQLIVDGELIPYLNLRSIFSIRSETPEKQKIIIIQNGQHRIGLITDEVIGEYQAVLKPFDGFFINKHYFIGASLLADGNLCVILDTPKLLSEKIKHTI